MEVGLTRRQYSAASTNSHGFPKLLVWCLAFVCGVDCQTIWLVPVLAVVRWVHERPPWVLRHCSFRQSLSRWRGLGYSHVVTGAFVRPHRLTCVSGNDPADLARHYVVVQPTARVSYVDNVASVPGALVFCVWRVSTVLLLSVLLLLLLLLSLLLLLLVVVVVYMVVSCQVSQRTPRGTKPR